MGGFVVPLTTVLGFKRSIELTISYVYHALHAFADRDNVRRPPAHSTHRKSGVLHKFPNALLAQQRSCGRVCRLDFRALQPGSRMSPTRSEATPSCWWTSRWGQTLHADLPHARSFAAGRPFKPVMLAFDNLLPTLPFTLYRRPSWWMQNKRGGRVKLHTLVSPETECASIPSCPLCPRSGDPAASQ